MVNVIIDGTEYPGGNPMPVSPQPSGNGDDISFAITREKPGMAGIHNFDDTPLRFRDWELNYRTGTVGGFAGMHVAFPWVRFDKYPASWEPAGADIYRIQRKGASGADAQRLVFTCSPNTAAIPAGDAVVVWDAPDDLTVSPATAHTLAGWSLPLRSKLTVAACTPSAPYDTAGRRLVEIDAGVPLPAIDYSPAFWAGEGGIQKSSMQLRHWSFWRNAATKEPRRPFGGFVMNILRAIKYDGYVIVGGNRWSPNTYDWSRDYLNFGASLTEELYRKEQAGIAELLGATDPRRLAVQLEERPQFAWADAPTVPGYRTLLNDVFYPTARAAWGQERTLVVRTPQAFNTALTQFDWRPPLRQSVILAASARDTGITGPAGAVTFANITETDWVATKLQTLATSLGFRAAALVSVAASGSVDTTIKAQRLGRILTSGNSFGVSVWLEAFHGADPKTTNNPADFFIVNGGTIEAFYPEMRQYCARAGLTFT